MQCGGVPRKPIISDYNCLARNGKAASFYRRGPPVKEAPSGTDNTAKLQPYLSPLAVWALSVGSAIGWGSLVVTGKTYLSQAGPLGSILGLLIGFAMMLMVANH